MYDALKKLTYLLVATTKKKIIPSVGLEPKKIPPLGFEPDYQCITTKLLHFSLHA